MVGSWPYVAEREDEEVLQIMEKSVVGSYDYGTPPR
jgi:hypothetical protein